MVLKDIIDKQLFSFQKGFSSWEDAIRTACQPLVDKGIADPEYSQYIINNVHEFGPYIVIAPEICIPHAQEGKGVNETAIAFMNVEEAVDFGEDSEYKPRLFFVLASTDNEKHLANLSELVTLVEDEAIIEQFIAAKSQSDLEALLEKVGG